MAFVLSDRIKETTTTTSTGTYTLGGAVSGFETFTANLSNGDTTYYCCTDGTDFEVGLGTFASSGTTLARTTIISSSNSNNAVNWSSGSRDIFCTLPGSKAVFKDGSDNINGTFVGNITGNVTGNADTASAVAADNISAGDAAINLTTTSGNITIDAQGSDTDIILKGTDGSTDTNFLTFDGSSFGDATFSGTLRSPRGIETSSYFWMKTDGNTALFAGANFEVQLTHVHNTGFKLFNAGTGTPAVELQFNDANEAIGSDGTNLKLTSGGNEITVPNSGADTMTLNAATQTLTNKTLTSPKINEDVAVTATATEINKLDGVTATTTELNYVDVTTLGTVEASKAVTADANGDVLFPDNEVLQFGTGGDLKIFHNPNNSIIQESGSGSLFIDASDLNLRNGAGSATYATFADGGAVELNHNNVKKFETTSDGATVTGDLLHFNFRCYTLVVQISPITLYI